MDYRTNRQSKDLSIYSCQFGRITSRIFNWRPYLYMALNVWMGIPSSWVHVWMIGFVYSILGDIVISVIAGILVARLYKVFRKVRNMKPTRVQKERMV